jgi:hypothetical protein
MPAFFFGFGGNPRPDGLEIIVSSLTSDFSMKDKWKSQGPMMSSFFSRAIITAINQYASIQNPSPRDPT